MSTEGQSGGREDDQVLVAEYALGLLEGGERAAVARRIASDPLLASDLRLWRSRLATLDEEFAEVAAPAGVLPRIESRLFGASASGGWWNSLALWRGLTAAAAAVAVIAVGVNLMQPRVDANALATQLVAAIQAQEGSGVEFVALYDQATGEVRITSLKGTAVPDKDFELWYIKGEQPAVSMGVIPVDQRKEIPLDAAAKANIEPGTVLAVTLEQKGGSPTGVAQGPIVAVGTVTPI
ncbi:anti-sigma factor [Devosia sp. A16]|uniref:anti-sigma factor n=1 Tax=Devosia sp. A16 TaxID=1736675 RepID=UPI0006D832BB|nr:anti-sigma factor [Devosia sp. A16]